MQVALVSSCTNRKKLTPPPELQACTLPEGTAESVAKEWARRIESSSSKVLARDLYSGRASTEIMAAAKVGQGSCYIVSAGLGLISVDEKVPAYDLTVAGSDQQSVLQKLPQHLRKPMYWWTALNAAMGHRKPLATLIDAEPARLFVLALPSTYLELVRDDLEALSDAAVRRVRIVGLSSHERLLPKALASSLVPYDERLEDPQTGYAGTRSDFPQRAARHFVSCIVPDSGSATAAEHARQVANFLSRYSRPAIPNRVRHTDEMLKDVIRGMWGESQGRVTNGLRLLRRERKIACEQSRFKRLFWEVAEEKGANQ